MMSYTQMKVSEVDKRARKYFEKIGLCYTDTSLIENGGGRYRIDAIVRCNNFKIGKNSNTLFYRFYDTDLFDRRSSRDSEFEHIPCREVYNHSTTQWHDMENRAYSVDVQHDKPEINDDEQSESRYFSEDLMAYLLEEFNHSDFDVTD